MGSTKQSTKTLNNPRPGPGRRIVAFHVPFPTGSQIAPHAVGSRLTAWSQVRFGRRRSSGWRQRYSSSSNFLNVLLQGVAQWWSDLRPSLRDNWSHQHQGRLEPVAKAVAKSTLPMPPSPASPKNIYSVSLELNLRHMSLKTSQASFNLLVISSRIYILNVNCIIVICWDLFTHSCR